MTQSMSALVVNIYRSYSHCVRQGLAFCLFDINWQNLYLSN